jgi:hypothetical protein
MLDACVIKGSKKTNLHYAYDSKYVVYNFLIQLN